MTDLLAALPRAIARRHDLLPTLHREGTDCYRILHGIAEGAPGITVDRYGPVLLLQTFRTPLPNDTVAAAAELVRRELGLDLAAVANHRGRTDAPPAPAEELPAAATTEHLVHEGGLRFCFRARHRGQDPWLFLDLRAGRAAVRQRAAGRRVLNLFAYTCGVGVAAAAGGADFVQNVDFARSALDVGARNVAANGLDPARCTLLQSDCLPVLRQLAGMPVQRRGKHVPFVPVACEPYDLIVLDPPRFAKSPFGTIDVVHDYQSLWKPALLALRDGGTIVATNHVPAVPAADWHDALRRCAEKAGRPLRSLEPLPVAADFPSFDGAPPLKVVVAGI